MTAGGIAAGTALTTILMNKYAVIAILVLILYFTGAFSVITRNPMIVVFGFMAFFVMNWMGRGPKRRR